MWNKLPSYIIGKQWFLCKHISGDYRNGVCANKIDEEYLAIIVIRTDLATIELFIK